MADSCTAWDCRADQEGNFCPNTAPGAQSKTWRCTNQKWVEYPTPASLVPVAPAVQEQPAATNQVPAANPQAPNNCVDANGNALMGCNGAGQAPIPAAAPVAPAGPQAAPGFP